MTATTERPVRSEPHGQRFGALIQVRRGRRESRRLVPAGPSREQPQGAGAAHHDALARPTCPSSCAKLGAGPGRGRDEGPAQALAGRRGGNGEAALGRGLVAGRGDPGTTSSCRASCCVGVPSKRSSAGPLRFRAEGPLAVGLALERVHRRQRRVPSAPGPAPRAATRKAAEELAPGPTAARTRRWGHRPTSWRNPLVPIRQRPPPLLALSIPGDPATRRAGVAGLGRAPRVGHLTRLVDGPAPTPPRFLRRQGSALERPGGLDLVELARSGGRGPGKARPPPEAGP